MSGIGGEIPLLGGGASGAELTVDAVGGKAANLARLDRLGLRVPPAVALPVSLCRHYMDRGGISERWRARITGALERLERHAGVALGDRGALVVSVRSSPPVSMPGMLGTLLNVGLTEQAIARLIRRTGNPWLAWDAYRRLVQSYGELVYDCPAAPFERRTAEHLAATGVSRVQDLDAWSLRGLARGSVKLLEETAGRGIPPDPFAQTIGAVEAVLRSWTSPRAREYRRLNGLDERSGTGVLIQAMVFGNSGARSGSGVGFTRNPATGADELFIDFLFNAQGEDIVSGRLPMAERDRLSAALPDVWAELHAARPLLEREFRDMQDFEFTVEAGKLFFLQTRAGKRTPWAALQIAVDLVRAGSLDRASAIDRLAPYDLASLTRVAVRPRSSDVPIAAATSASVGVATGEVVFDADRARQLAADRPVILAREDLTTDDIAGLAASAGVIATHGARTSHAAVVARQLGKVCLVGCAALRIDADAREAAIGTRRVREGDVLTLDGETGRVYQGRVPIVSERPVEALVEYERWRQGPAGSACA